MSKGGSHPDTYNAHEPPPKSLYDSKVAVFSMERGSLGQCRRIRTSAHPISEGCGRAPRRLLRVCDDLLRRDHRSRREDVAPRRRPDHVRRASAHTVAQRSHARESYLRLRVFEVPGRFSCHKRQAPLASALARRCGCAEDTRGSSMEFEEPLERRGSRIQPGNGSVCSPRERVSDRR